MKRSSTITILFILLVTAVTYWVFFLANQNGTAEETRVIVPKGMTVQALADSLSNRGVLRSKLSFTIAARILGTGRKLSAGVYRIAYGLSNMQILERLTGVQYAIIFQATFPEGLTMRKVAAIAHDRLELDSALFMKYATDPQFIHSLGVPKEAKTAEGYLFPDTYRFVISTDPKALIIRMIGRWKTVVNDSMRDKAAGLELSVHQLMTFASIVESEARLASERDTIAGVYWNRLEDDIKLDADPTVQYGLGLNHPITHDDLLAPNPYNTYLNKGLPPGPINSPGAAAIHAVLSPAEHNKLYFVARRDGSGGHYFSHSLKEQDRMINQAKQNSSR
jgi:UPF0755 protein